VSRLTVCGNCVFFNKSDDPHYGGCDHPAFGSPTLDRRRDWVACTEFERKAGKGRSRAPQATQEARQ
jgi:hypothetical protein